MQYRIGQGFDLHQFAEDASCKSVTTLNFPRRMPGSDEKGHIITQNPLWLTDQIDYTISR